MNFKVGDKVRVTEDEPNCSGLVKDEIVEIVTISRDGHSVLDQTFDLWIVDSKYLEPVSKDGGTKHDDGKPMLDLLSTEWMEGVGRVLTFGAKKYAPSNWRKGIAYSRLIAACMRHLFAFIRGEELDPESGEGHLYHASCCLMFLSEMARTRKDLDDRYKG